VIFAPTKVTPGSHQYGGGSPGVAAIKVPEDVFQELFRRGLIVEHPVLGPGNFQITPQAQIVINQLLGH
jgi:hypothetical protein